MIRRKKQMDQKLKYYVDHVFQKYRVSSHRDHDKAIDDVCAALQDMKHSQGKPHRCTLYTRSEWLEAKRKIDKALWKRILGRATV